MAASHASIPGESSLQPHLPLEEGHRFLSLRKARRGWRSGVRGQAGAAGRREGRATRPPARARWRRGQVGSGSAGARPGCLPAAVLSATQRLGCPRLRFSGSDPACTPHPDTVPLWKDETSLHISASELKVGTAVAGGEHSFAARP